jgi:hypothetical protein
MTRSIDMIELLAVREIQILGCENSTPARYDMSEKPTGISIALFDVPFCRTYPIGNSKEKLNS